MQKLKSGCNLPFHLFKPYHFDKKKYQNGSILLLNLPFKNCKILLMKDVSISGIEIGSWSSSSINYIMRTNTKTEYQEIGKLEQRTIRAIYKGKKERVVRIYIKVEEMFSKGSENTRSIISNAYILPLSQLLELNYSWGKQYLELLPKQLKIEYCRQINRSGL